jgi:flagellar protein FliO/FliZ
MSFLSAFGENRTLAFILAAVCLLIGVALVFVLFRVVFGRGIKLPGGRTRQQRLGIVDAFEIDRQRQLVIVRRDNVEHLIMIGGPNDVVVESSIIRAEARESREPRPAREREPPAISGLSWPAGPAASETAAQTQAEPAPAAPRPAVPEPPPPPPISVVPPSRQIEPAAEPQPAAELAAAPEPPPPQPRPARPPLPPLRPVTAGERPILPPRPPLTPLRREPRPLPPFLANRGKPGDQAGPSPTLGPAAESLPAAQPEPEPAASPEAPPPPTPAAEAETSQAGPETQAAVAPKIELDPLESLEEEMAKLLGRSPNP